MDVETLDVIAKRLGLKMRRTNLASNERPADISPIALAIEPFW